MFPTRIEGEFPAYLFSGEKVTIVLDEFERRLRKARAVLFTRTEDSVTFRGGFAPSWNLLVLVNYGEIKLSAGDPGKLMYRFSTSEMLIVAAIMACFAGLFVFTSTGHVFFAGIVFVMCWVWLFGANYLIAKYRLVSFVKETYDQAHSGD